MQAYGRRMTLVGISVPYILGFYLMGLSYYANWTPLLFIGRVITGLLTGASAPTSQIYVSIDITYSRLLDYALATNVPDTPLIYNNQVSECSSPRVRGALGSFTATFLSLGIVVSYIIGALVQWQIFCFIIGTLPVLLGLAMVRLPTIFWYFPHSHLIWLVNLLLSQMFMPETPSWLVSQDRDEKARVALQQLRGK